MVGGEPAVDDFKNLHAAITDVNRARGLFTTMTRIALDPDVHASRPGSTRGADGLREDPGPIFSSLR
jgi:hypothetical protein